MMNLFKRILLLFIIFFTATNLVTARAGISNSSTGSSSNTSSSSGHVRRHNSNRNNNGQKPIVSFLGHLSILLILGSSVIVFEIKLINRKRHTKKIMRLLDNKDHTWKYKNIQRIVVDSYYNLQKAWTSQNLKIAKDYISPELYEMYEIRIEWMKMRKEKNILKKIKLKKAIPVQLHDDIDDSKDYVWYYIKGQMVDYTINVNTLEIVNGNNTKSTFVEYWKFGKSNTKWVLKQIIQETDQDKISFK